MTTARDPKQSLVPQLHCAASWLSCNDRATFEIALIYRGGAGRGRGRGGAVCPGEIPYRYRGGATPGYGTSRFLKTIITNFSFYMYLARFSVFQKSNYEFLTLWCI